MAKYIDCEALEVDLNHRLNFLMGENGEYDHYTSGFDEAVTRVENFPDADVAPVVHGRKIEDGDIGCFWLCSLCGECLPYGANYCPNCGAKMVGGED